MTKTFVLRPNSLLSSERSPLKFGNDNIIVIPMAVLDEINKMKGLSLEKQRVWGAIKAYINSFKHEEIFSESGAKQSNGSIIRIVTNFKDQEVPEDEELSRYQLRTLQVCLGLKKEGHTVVLVTNNMCLQMRARNLKINAEYFRDETFPRIEDQYRGRTEITVPDGTLMVAKDGVFLTSDILDSVSEGSLTINEFVLLKEETTGRTCLGMVKGETIEIQMYQQREPYGVKPMNIGQQMLFNALFSEAPLVIVKGEAGTGKTYVSLAVALDMLEHKEFERILVTRKTDYSSMGYLPGDIASKMSPYMAGFKDNLENLLRTDPESQGQGTRKKVTRFCTDDPREDGSYFFETGQIKVEAIEMLRGRTITNTIFIIDETQNIEPGLIKTIVTRAGKGSKFIFLGDPTQIDNPQLNERYNGLVYLSEKMRGSPNTIQVTLNGNESVRSQLAKEAASIL